MLKMANNNGVTYHKLKSQYAGDITKGCGLTGFEIDSNFHFLRGYDILDAYWDNKRNAIILQRLNGNEILINADELKPIIDLSGTSYNSETGVLTLEINGQPMEISGFSTCDCEKIIESLNELSDKYDELLCRVEDLNNNVINLTDFSETLADTLDQLQHRKGNFVVWNFVYD